MNKIRLVGRLDIKGPNLIKGVRFEGLRVMGDPEKFALKYYEEGIDEITYIDTVASLYGRNNLLEYVKKIGKKVFIPLTVGGGIRSIEDAELFLNSGADKVALNTAALRSPKIINQIAKRFGSQSVSIMIDAKKKSENNWEAYTLQGREKTDKDVIEWVKEIVGQGAGEIILTSVDKDGTLKGFDTNLISRVSEVCRVPLIAGGGFGKLEDLKEVIQISKKINISVGTAIHKKIFTIKEIKSFIKKNGCEVRN